MPLYVYRLVDVNFNIFEKPIALKTIQSLEEVRKQVFNLCKSNASIFHPLFHKFEFIPVQAHHPNVNNVNSRIEVGDQNVLDAINSKLIFVEKIEPNSTMKPLISPSIFDYIPVDSVQWCFLFDGKWRAFTTQQNFSLESAYKIAYVRVSE